MGKIREHTNEMRQKCEDLNKSGNSLKKKGYIYDNVIFTVRVILKKSEAVVHQPGR